jgi:two-component system chemotaxis response regulator CheB
MTSDAPSDPGAVVAVAASAGGVEALIGLVATLPKDFPAALLVVLHIPPAGPSVLPHILSRSGKLPARHPVDGEALVPGVIFAAPPDRHLRVQDGAVRVVYGPRENGHRPSADALFRSVAQSYGDRSAGVVLSGTMDDGAAGLRVIGAAGGLTIVQAPDEAAFPGMPQAAIGESHPQLVCPVAEMGEALGVWLDGLVLGVPEVEVAIDDPEAISSDDLSPFTCPDCGGSLWLHDEHGVRRYRCRVGHSFSAEGLLLGKREALEAALWAAVVALRERSDLMRRIVKRLEGTGRRSQLERYFRDIAATDQRAELLRGLIDDLVQEVPNLGADRHIERDVDEGTS